MQTTRITDENLGDFIPLLRNDEIFGINEDRYIGFGAYDEDENRPMAILVVDIFPEYVRIINLYTDPVYRKQGAASALLSIITDNPEGENLPIYIISSNTEINVDFLSSRNFKEVESKYYYLSGNLGDMSKIPLKKDLKEGLVIKPINQVSNRELQKFLSHSPHDDFLEFPEIIVDKRRFSDGSIVCFREGKISALILMREFDDFIQISWIYGTDYKSLYVIFSMVKSILLTDYSEKANIRFLLSNEKGRETIQSILKNHEELPIHIFKLSAD
ncbi:MAG: hypothetical protein K5989_04380 [Lachnospiraceae bacterium]|nr:hypothetical protein [Lachnospiraceae bacterium]